MVTNDLDELCKVIRMSFANSAIYSFVLAVSPANTDCWMEFRQLKMKWGFICDFSAVFSSSATLCIQLSFSACCRRMRRMRNRISSHKANRESSQPVTITPVRFQNGTATCIGLLRIGLRRENLLTAINCH